MNIDVYPVDPCLTRFFTIIFFTGMPGTKVTQQISASNGFLIDVCDQKHFQEEKKINQTKISQFALA